MRHRHGLGPLLGEGLGREHVFDLARADAEGEGAEGTVRRGVRVAAHDGHARLGDAEFGSDDVDDALILVTTRKDRDAELLAVLLERFELASRDRVGDRRRDGIGRYVVVGGRERAVGTAHGATVQAQAVEGLGARHLVDEVQVDVEEGLLALGDAMTCSSQIFS